MLGVIIQLFIMEQGCTGAIYKCIDLLNIKHYVNFYETLESLAKIHNTLFKGNKDKDIELKHKLQYQIMTIDLREKIDKYYRLFFLNVIFVIKLKLLIKIYMDVFYVKNILILKVHIIHMKIQNNILIM